ncbi:hypothetical protein F5B22DRAFT_640434 [Xylaria bambusicola]|uniref:uncharacterized protein n=1 Tax=Xylaria bambusicola TaxID=326684 RepID=UPI0020083217|nr:uncharacterized protein F5B22DRAFT_640434 [Xylaria bambusicola]KAI0503049.1 hypothetical protein F5B22DRAFT_640434 [Xylaria bambusicola]
MGSDMRSDTVRGSTDYERILTATQRLANALIPDHPLFMTFHDGQVHDPLGGGAYAFQNDIVGPMLLALLEDEAAHDSVATRDELMSSNGLPTRPIVIDAGLQPNNSPHLGTLVVFCYAFSIAKGIRDRMRVLEASGKDIPPSVTVLITFVDTAPVKDKEMEVEGIQYQRSHRDVQDALSTYMADYEEVVRYLSMWADVPVNVAFQADFFSNSSMPVLLNYMILHHETLGRQLSPKYGSLALRSACPVPGCGLAEKHGRLNEYRADNNGQDGIITFHCPHHGPHAVRLSCPAETARLEANAPTRNLLRSMTHLLDTTTHHIRVTGADYAGVYQEMFLYRPLAAWSAITGLARGRTPHILYAPLIVDWSGAKLSKSLYIRDGAYEFMKQQGMDGFCSYARLRERFGGDGSEGLRKIWDEVQRWMADPKKLFRSFSVAYFHAIILRDVGS